jgi:exosortase
MAVLAFFYLGIDLYGPRRGFSTLYWLYRSWNPATDYEHGILVPVIIAGLIRFSWPRIRAAAGHPDWAGLILVVLGALLYLAAFRTIQARIAVASLPFVLLGSCWFLWGRRVAVLLAFPLFFLYLAIPLPSFQQATVHLQRLAAYLAHHVALLAGVENFVQGTTVVSPTQKWNPLEISGGCSGIRSLMALIMISSAWAYVAPLALWKRAVLLASAVPLAIIGNALRVGSIVILAQHGDAKFAAGTWHDWSGLLLFYPVSLAMMLGLHALLEGGTPWRAAARRRLSIRSGGAAR